MERMKEPIHIKCHAGAWADIVMNVVFTNGMYERFGNNDSRRKLTIRYLAVDMEFEEK